MIVQGEQRSRQREPAPAATPFGATLTQFRLASPLRANLTSNSPGGREYTAVMSDEWRESYNFLLTPDESRVHKLLGSCADSMSFHPRRLQTPAREEKASPSESANYKLPGERGGRAPSGQRGDTARPERSRRARVFEPKESDVDLQKQILLRGTFSDRCCQLSTACAP